MLVFYFLNFTIESAMKNFFTFKTKALLFILLFLAFSLNLSGYYMPYRYAFPAICVDHFNNDIATRNTWLESAGSDFIDPLKKYLPLIPRPYEADCNGCSGCGGFRLNLSNAFEWPGDQEDLCDEIW